MLVSIEVKSMFMEDIKTKQYEDIDFEELKTNIKMGKSPKTSFDGNGVIDPKCRSCVPRVNYLIRKLLWSLMVHIIPFLRLLLRQLRS